MMVSIIDLLDVKTMFEKNVGSIDKIVRAILGVVFLVLVYYFFTAGSDMTNVLLWVIFLILAVVMFVTAIFGTCPIWSVLNINTNKA